RSACRDPVHARRPDRAPRAAGAGRSRRLADGHQDHRPAQRHRARHLRRHRPQLDGRQGPRWRGAQGGRLPQPLPRLDAARGVPAMSTITPHTPPSTPHWIRPYGDTLDDGRVQLSFTLPAPMGEEAKEAARQLALQLGIEGPAVVHSEAMGPGFSFHVLYGRCRHRVDLAGITVSKPAFEVLDKEAINARIRQEMGRKMVVIGACIETDAHTVGIDAIMNMKGYNGHKGLESYAEIRAINLGAQVDSEVLVSRAIEEQADVILVSQ